MKFVKVPVIRTPADHEWAARRLSFFLRPTYKGPRRDPDEIKALAVALQDYESVKFPTSKFTDPVSAIKFRMEQLGMAPADLIPIIGSQAAVSRLLSGQRVTLQQLRKLHKELELPGDALLKPVRRSRKPRK